MPAGRLLRRVLCLALLAAACTPATDDATTSTSPPTDSTTRQAAAITCPVEGEPLAETMIYIEHNATETDTGVHGLLSNDAWGHLCVRDPEGRQILLVDPEGQLGELNLADIFFESREPPNDEFSVDDLTAAFPEGDYVVSGTDFEGTDFVGTARFTHQIPAPPTITAPELSDEEEGEDQPVADPGGVEVRWEPVTETIDGEPVDIVSYEVIVTKVDHQDPDALSQPEYDVHMSPGATTLPVPEAFFESDTLYELEVLAVEESGNQTIALGFFRTG
jgi:hypothetical protein